MQVCIKQHLIFLLSFSITTYADDHIKPQEGAFTSLYVSAADIDKYVSFLKKNTEAFKTIGSSDAGVCITRSGNQYPGQMMIWNAFSSVEDAMVGSLKYLGEGKWNIKDFKKAFKSENRSKCAPPAPACGLYLKEIKY